MIELTVIFWSSSFFYSFLILALYIPAASGSSSVAASWKGLRNILGGTCSDELVFEVRL
jgi:hypothetical protein